MIHSHLKTKINTKRFIYINTDINIYINIIAYYDSFYSKN